VLTRLGAIRLRATGLAAIKLPTSTLPTTGLR
jgi:hypothetical protein